MTSNCEDVSARMMELLYGELPADARARVDAHVAGCARCRAELEGFEKTRAVARRGLDEAPPARAHAAIMRAAAAHLAAQAQTPVQPAAAARRQPAAPVKQSFWDRLRGIRWAFPTLATVGAVAVFMVANRVFLNPERALEPRRGRETAVVTAPAEPAPAERKWEGRPPRPEDHEPSADGLDRRPAEMDEAASRAHHGKHAEGGDPRSRGTKMKQAEGAAPSFVTPPSWRQRRAEEKAKSDPDRVAENKFAPPPPPRESEPAAEFAKEADKAAAPRAEAPGPRVDAPRSPAPARKPAATTAASAPPAQARGINDLLAAESERPRGGGGSVTGKGALGAVAGTRGKSDGYGAGAGAAQPAPTAPRPAPVAAAEPPGAAPAAAQSLKKSRAKKSSAIAADEADEGGAEASPAKDEKKVAGKNAASSANDATLQRADRLFADGHWAEAAALYRELLRRDPRNDDAERWRRRLAAAENAEVNDRRNASVAARRAAQGQEKADSESASRAAKPAAKAPAKASKAADVAQ